MSIINVNGIEVTCNEDIDATLANAYIKEVKARNPGKILKSVDIVFDGDYANVNFKYRVENFERIRRITGYLVGTTDRWNNGKRAEEHDRVKHSIPSFDIGISGAEKI